MTVSTELFVWSVLKTRWPVSEASMPVEAVSSQIHAAPVFKFISLLH